MIYSEKFLEKLKQQSVEHNKKTKNLSYRQRVYESIENGESMYDYSYDMDCPNTNKRRFIEW